MGMKKKAVVLHSGGLDSTVCLMQAIAADREVLSLGIDYGQRHRIELIYAERQCEGLGVPRKLLHVTWDKPERSMPAKRRLEEIRQGVSPAFLPGRNIVFLALASAEAAGIGASEVWIGVNAVDFSGYPDCRPAFVDAFQELISEGFTDGPRIVTPLLHLSKPEVAESARQLGLEKGETWSCYRPVVSETGIETCGECDACVLHEYAWSEHVEPSNREQDSSAG